MMEKILLPIILGIVIIYIVFSIIHKKQILKRKQVVSNAILNSYPNATIDFGNLVKVHFEDTEILIKMIQMNPRYELILTNPKKWVINENPKEWRMSGNHQFVEGVRSFVEYQNPEKKVIKIALIYPQCYNISRYINESDVVLVKNQEKVDQIYFVDYPSFQDLIEKL